MSSPAFLIGWAYDREPGFQVYSCMTGCMGRRSLTAHVNGDII